MFKKYYYLTKPGMVRGNVFIAICGFLLAARGYVDGWLLVAMVAGLSLVIAAGCVFNNYIDRGIDSKMSRTKNRVLVKQRIPAKYALLYGAFLGVLGIYILAVSVSILTVFLAGIGFVFYVVFYSISKRRSVHGTLVGAVSGAMPPVIGYCAVTNTFDLGAFLLFSMLVLWQMPHFYSIALYRLDDYSNASIPVLPVKEGLVTTQHAMLVYIVAFWVAALTLYFFGYTGPVYLVVVIVLCLAWFVLCIKGFYMEDTKRWARKMFVLSLIVLMTLFSTIAIDSFLPR